MSTLMNVGCPHFEGEIRKYRQADYNIYKSLYEFIDNIVTKCDRIVITLKFSENEFIEIRISDNYTEGFKDLGNEKVENPFNMSHMRDGQNDDDEMSQFGIGMKAGAISLSQKMNIFTRVQDKFYDIEMDFLEMSRRKDPIESFNPKKKQRGFDEYKENHPFDYGSTIILSNIRKVMYSYLNEDEAVKDIIKNISLTYGEILESGNVEIIVNNEVVKPHMSLFKEKECIPFNRECSIYRLINYETKDIKFVGKFRKYVDGDLETTYKFYNKETRKLNKCKEEVFKNLLDSGYEYTLCFNDEFECLRFKSTFTMYHPLMIDEKNARENIPRSRILIYRDGRLYGNWHKENSNDGCGNFTVTRMDFKSKEIAKNLGLTFNKNISQNINNDLYYILKQFYLELKKGFNASTDTSANVKLYEIARQNDIPVSKGNITGDEGINLLDRRPTKFRGSDSEMPIKPTTEKINGEQFLKNVIDKMKDFKKLKVNDYDLEKLKKKEVKTKLNDALNILEKFLNTNLK